jgi:hypothetical protein
MRLSLMKGAYADLSGTAWQEIGVKPSFGLSGLTARDPLLHVSHARPRQVKISAEGVLRPRAGLGL